MQLTKSFLDGKVKYISTLSILFMLMFVNSNLLNAEDLEKEIKSETAKAEDKIDNAVDDAEEKIDDALDTDLDDLDIDLKSSDSLEKNAFEITLKYNYNMSGMFKYNRVQSYNSFGFALTYLPKKTEGFIDAITFERFSNKEVETKTTKDVEGKSDILRYGLDLKHYFAKQDNALIPYALVGMGSFEYSDSKSAYDSTYSFDFGGGVKYRINSMFSVDGEIKHSITFGDIKENTAFSLGLTLGLFPKKDVPESILDADKDGVIDSEDRCANTPKGTTVDSEGCRVCKVILDDDRDGVANDNDQCPDSDPQFRVNAEGCYLDSDKDGILDPEDQCENSNLNFAVNSFGCHLDTDKDGVIDPEDVCPNSDPQFKVNSEGCYLDGDNDGVLDPDDKCRNTPRGAKITSDGCSYSTNFEIKFQTAKSTIEANSIIRMERFGKFLQENPKYSAKISGYTDSVGNPEANIRLSQRRAKVVYDYFIKNYGISPERLSYKGYGATNFIATNDTEQGRRKNRRVHAIAFIK